MSEIIKFYVVSDRYGQLSNFAPYPIIIADQLWPSAEHYFQAQKFTNKKHREKIRNAKTAVTAKRLGHDKRCKLRPDWEAVKVEIMREALEAKFTQHSALVELLMSTKDSQLIEHTAGDSFWGDGGDGQGKNMTGVILMELRQKLRQGSIKLLKVDKLDLKKLRDLVETVENRLNSECFIVIHTFIRNDRKLHLALTERLRITAKKGKVWKSRAFLTTLKNAEYGFDFKKARSSRGRDGIYLLDRSFKPKNSMMKKIFDNYLDKANSGVEEVAQVLKTDSEKLLPVRLVSHSMRLLGVLCRGKGEDWLVLVDYDDTK